MNYSKKIALLWQGINIQILYTPIWCDMENGQFISLAEIKSENRQPLLITHTGYRSHFFPSTFELSEDELVSLVKDWLDQEAKKPEWLQTEEHRRQFSLF